MSHLDSDASWSFVEKDDPSCAVVMKCHITEGVIFQER